MMDPIGALEQVRTILGSEHPAVEALERAARQIGYLDRYEQLRSVKFHPECAFLHDHLGGSMSLQS